MKNFDFKTLQKKFAVLRKENKIVMAHGVFDLFHYGHLKHLQAAKQMGDILIVSVTADQFINKGLNRPFFNLNKIIEILKNLKFVDYVIPSNSKTAEANLLLIKPHIYVKGNDYSNKTKNNDPDLFKEMSLVKNYKGKIKIIKEIQFSSSSLINQQELSKEYLKIFKNLYRKLDFEEIEKSFIDRDNIVVVGDLITDKFVFSKSLGKSRKNNLISTRYIKTEFQHGGALMIYLIIQSFFKKARLVLFGNKKNLTFVSKIVAKKNILFCNINKDTVILKTRFVDAYDKSKLFQVNENDILSFNRTQKSKVINYFKKTILDKNKSYKLIITDFGQGYMFEDLVYLINKSKIFKFINCQANSSNFGYNLFNKYKNVEHISCDEDEFRLVNQDLSKNLKDSLTSFQKDMEKLKLKNLLVTAGKNGCYHLSKEGKKNKLKYLHSLNSRKFIDSIGSGDTFFAYYIILQLTKKFSIEEILSFCHLAASLHCENFANSSPIKKSEFLNALKYFIKIN
jgi:rfaE bifunctional protein nucleotidyltransferase chain/domain